MNRLCIYVTYNQENKIHEYMGRVLQELQTCCSKLYLVCNYLEIKEGKEYALPWVDDIFYRKNVGYDSGAYKEVLCDFLGWETVYQYEELLLVNDSFFGFFYPLQESFDRMAREECDFWGMTGQAAGEYRNPTYPFDAHVHSYFFVFKRQVMRSKVFREFWERLSYPEKFREAIVFFEIKINHDLEQSGFRKKSLIENCGIPWKRNENPCYSRLYELVKNYRLPLMKKKCVLIRNIGFADTLKTLKYMRQKNLYPVDWILSYLEHQFYIPKRGTIPCNSLEIFYHNHSDIYIYGMGVCGKNLALYFEDKGWHYRGFLVTDASGTDKGVVSLEEAEIDSDTGILISVLDPATAKEIERHIGKRCRREQLFFISKCAAIKLPD
jgi:hypothetical protein